VCCGHDGPHGFFDGQRGVDIRVCEPVSQQRDVDAAGSEFGHLIGGSCVTHLNVEVGEYRGHPSDRGRQEIWWKFQRHTDTQRRGVGVVTDADGSDDAVVVVDQTARFAKQQGTSFGGPYTGVVAFEKADAELFFESLDGLRQ